MRRLRSFRSRITAWSPICSRHCRSSPRNSASRARELRRCRPFQDRRKSRERENRSNLEDARMVTLAPPESVRTNAMQLDIHKVGVIGAGQMGNGIAHVCALSGFSVLLNDIALDRVKSSLATINGNMARQVGKNLISEEDRKAALGRITRAEKLDALADCDLVIETASEKEEVKVKIFAAICPLLRPEAIVGTNTSSISIPRLASTTDRPEKFIGIHFMNPVPLMELVELVRGIATNDTTFETTKAFVTKLGKIPAVAEDFPAFIVNRILLPMINEAIYPLYERVGAGGWPIPSTGPARCW